MAKAVNKSLLNKANVRRYAIDYASSLGKPFTRVGADIYEMLETDVRDKIEWAVRRSVGKTVALVTRSRHDERTTV